MGPPVFQDRRGLCRPDARELFELIRIGSIDVDHFRRLGRKRRRKVRLTLRSLHGLRSAFGHEKTGAMTHCIHAARDETEDGEHDPRYPFIHGLLSDP